MKRNDLNLMRDRIADAMPRTQAALARLAEVASRQHPTAAPGAVDELRGIVCDLAADARCIVAEYERARFGLPGGGQ